MQEHPIVMGLKIAAIIVEAALIIWEITVIADLIKRH